METPSLEPATEAWDLLRERIIETEERAVRGTNQTRDALLEQGDLFAEISPPSTRGVSTGALVLLEQMARECGIAPRTAVNRRDLSAQIPAGGDFRQRLVESSDIIISWATVYEIVTQSPEPEVTLNAKIKKAREAGSTRLRREDVRRQRGISLNPPRALTPEPARDPEPEPEPEPEVRPRPPREPLPPEDQVLVWVDRIYHFGTLLQKADQGGELRRAADYLNALADGLSAKDLTPEMFR